jgi:hypothetical protein
MNDRMEEFGTPNTFEVEGESVTYDSDGDSAIPVTAIYRPMVSEETKEDDGIGKISRAEFKFQTTEVPSPAVGGFVTRDSVKWTIDMFIGETAGFTVVEASTYNQQKTGVKDSTKTRDI